MAEFKKKTSINIENINEMTLLAKRIERASKELRVAMKELSKFKLKMSMEMEDDG